MVLLHVKRGEVSLFLYETTVNESIGKILGELVKLQNLRLRLQRLTSETQELIQYGPYKPEDQHGYTEEQLALIGQEKNNDDEQEEEQNIPVVIRNGIQYALRHDPTGRRNGEAPIEEIAQMMRKTLDKANACLSKDLLTANKVLNEETLNEAIKEIKGAITIAYPMGLPLWDPVQCNLDDKEDLTRTAASKEVLDVENTTLWWASKELKIEKKLLDFVGRNEKSKLIVKFQKKGQGPPVKEAPLTEEAQRNLMAHYFRKQEQEKKLLENQDDDYLNSSWANNRSLKSTFNGVGNVSWRPK